MVKIVLCLGIMENLFFGTLTEADLLIARRYVKIFDYPPVWMRVVAGGDPEQLESVRAEAIRFFCSEHLEPYGLRVAPQKEDSDG